MKTESANGGFPAGLNQAYWFAGFNACSFQIVLSSPMILYAKHLGASATILGIIAGMMPLLVIFQIPAANYVAQIGYKRFVYAGWGTRVSFIFVMALVPLTAGFLDAKNRLALIIALLFCFNLSRGISSAGWLPWITSLVPAPVRGRYLARDAGCVNVASFFTFLLAAAGLGSHPKSWQFAALFGFSAVMGAASLVFLKRIPEGASPEVVRTSGTPVPWKVMIQFQPFNKLLRLVVAWSIAYGGLQAFTVAFLKTEAGLSEGTILLVSSASFLGGLSSLWFLGSRLDHFGSKPVLTFALGIWLLVIGGWGILAGNVIPPVLWFILVLQFAMGLFASLATMSNTRLAMAIVPVMGRNHFFAIFSVIGNVTLGLAPILWGILIDSIGRWHGHWAGIAWNRFSCFFLLVLMAFAGALVLARRLDEPEAASMEHLLREVLIHSPHRVWLRLWPR